MIYLSTWIDEASERDPHDQKSDGRATPQSAGPLTDWRCVLLFFTLAKQQINRRDDIKLCLFTHRDQMPHLYGVDMRDYLVALGVDIITIEPHWQPHFPNLSRYNQFFIFDILDFFEVHADDTDHFIIAAADCLAVAPLDPLFDVLIADGVLLIDVETQPDDDIHGITRRQASLFYGALGGAKQPLIAPYFSSEFFGLSGQRLGSLLAHARDAFQLNNRRAQSDLPYLTEQAHLLSYALLQIGVSESNADQFVRRIWTAWNLNNTRPSDRDLLIWDVPAEKEFGIKNLAARCARLYSKKKSVPEFDKHRLGEVLGIGQKRPLRSIYRFGMIVMRRMFKGIFKISV